MNSRPASTPHHAISQCVRRAECEVQRWGRDGRACEYEARHDLLALQRSSTWPTIVIIPQNEERDNSDTAPTASAQQGRSSAYAWAYIERQAAWNLTRVAGGGERWSVDYWARPTLNLNLALLRDGIENGETRKWAAIIVHELLHQFGHDHAVVSGPNFIYGVHECIEYENDPAAVLAYRRSLQR